MNIAFKKCQWYKHLCRQKLDSHLFLIVDGKREESVDSESFNVCLSEVFVKFSKMENGEHDAEKIDQDPDCIENIMSIGALHIAMKIKLII